jgi:hypothetical protein
MILFYPLITGAALRMVHCVRRRIVSESSGATAATLVLRCRLTVSCYTGEQRWVTLLAWGALTAYSLAFPLGTYWWLRHRLHHVTVAGLASDGVMDDGVGSTCAKDGDAARTSLSLSSSSPGESPSASSASRHSKHHSPKHCSPQPPLPVSGLQHTVLLSASRARVSPWSPFIGSDFRPQFFYFKHVHLAVLLGTMTAAELLQHPSLAQQASKTAFILALLGGYTAALLRARPYATMHEWKRPLKLSSLAVAAVAAMTNFLVFCSGEGGVVSALSSRTQARVRDSAAVMSWVLLGLCLSLVLLFVAALCSHLALGASREAGEPLRLHMHVHGPRSESVVASQADGTPSHQKHGGGAAETLRCSGLLPPSPREFAAATSGKHRVTTPATTHGAGSDAGPVPLLTALLMPYRDIVPRRSVRSVGARPAVTLSRPSHQRVLQRPVMSTRGSLTSEEREAKH